MARVYCIAPPTYCPDGPASSVWNSLQEVVAAERLKTDEIAVTAFKLRWGDDDAVPLNVDAKDDYGYSVWDYAAGLKEKGIEISVNPNALYDDGSGCFRIPMAGDLSYRVHVARAFVQRVVAEMHARGYDVSVDVL